jgi:hypothetical protein
MTRDQIYDLLELLPAGVSLSGVPAAPASRPTTYREFEQDMFRYADTYKNLQFGWHYVRALWENGVELTQPMREAAGPVLIAAYDYFTRDTRNPHIRDAWMLAASPDQRMHKAVVEAAFVSRDYTVDEAARRTGISTATLAAYEQLFFNVLDRRRDSLFIASIVYPYSRMVEMFDGYLRDPQSHFPALLMRSGYNNSIADLMYFAGHPDGNGLLSRHDSSTTPARLETLIMANGYLLAKNGWVNQPSTGIGQAKQLLAAARAGGEERGNDNSIFSMMGATLSNEVVSVKRGEASRSVDLLKRVKPL